MEKEVLRNLAGVDLYPLISLIVFFVFFIGVIIYVFKADKKFIAKMSRLPLENNNDNQKV